MKKYLIILAAALALCLSLSVTAFGEGGLPAFPGAEGGGKYTQGARASGSRRVYHVTNLNDSGAGSFREAVSRSGNIVVFDVGGVIDLHSKVEVRREVTILGQTAPGDGITLTGYDLNVSSQVIMRYLRVRPTSRYNDKEHDGIGGMGSDVIIDHCSTSWGIDELLTMYRGSNVTVQNTISSESLRLSNHVKGAHGYGGIFGGTDCTLHHNLFAHHDSRTPRLDRCLMRTDVRNNVIYDWGKTNSAYGGEPYYNDPWEDSGPYYVNWINNFYKYGPSTSNELRTRIFEVSGSADVLEDYKTRFCFKGNYVDGSPSVTENNALGVKHPEYAVLTDGPADMGDYEIAAESAEAAYAAVLDNAGATLPKRDAVDARIINDVRNRTGTLINSADEVGGVPDFEKAERVFEIPKEWKDDNGMGSKKETDIVPDGKWAGYTWVEAYANDLAANAQKPSNPKITIITPAIDSADESDARRVVLAAGEELTYSALAEPQNPGEPEIAYVDIYDGAERIKTVNSAEVNERLALSPGTHRLTMRAHNKNGEVTESPASVVYVKSADVPEGFSHAQIGSAPYGSAGGSWLDGSEYVMLASGRLARSSNGDKLTGLAGDSCDFMYKKLSGDFDISVRLDKMPKEDNGSSAGLMLRESLDPGARMVMLADGWLKYGENIKLISRSEDSSASMIKWMGIENSSSYDTSKYEYRLPSYMRLSRSGDSVTAYVSDSGRDWSDNPRQAVTVTLSGLADDLYVGFAADSGQPDRPPIREYMSEARFGKLMINGDPAVPDPTPTPEPKFSVGVEAAEHGRIELMTDASAGVRVGTRVDIAAVPDSGYFTDSVTVTGAGGADILVTKTADNRYSFVMPRENVTVAAVFLAEGTPSSSPKPRPTPFEAEPIVVNADGIDSGGRAKIENNREYAWTSAATDELKELFGDPIDPLYTSKFINMQYANCEAALNVRLKASGYYKLVILGNEYKDRYYSVEADGATAGELKDSKPPQYAVREDDPAGSNHTALTATEYMFAEELMPGEHSFVIKGNSDGKSRNICAAALIRIGGDDPIFDEPDPTATPSLTPEPTITPRPSPSGYRIISAAAESGRLSVSVGYDGAEPPAAKLMAAGYGEDGALLTDFAQIDIRGGGEYELDYFGAVKLFIWDGEDKAAPLCDPYTYING